MTEKIYTYAVFTQETNKIFGLVFISVLYFQEA